MNEKTIWDFLMDRTGNAYGTAAIMGNLMAESSLNPLCATGKNKTANYATDADNGVIDFVNDGVAFGLVQWCYYSRKQLLLDRAKANKKSVGDLRFQLDHLCWEMENKYRSVWTAVTEAKDIRTASDIVMLKYEKPAGTSESAKAKRGAYAQKFYAEFAETQQKAEASATEQLDTDVVPYVKRVVATDNVRIRAGDSKAYGQIGRLEKGQSMEWVATSNRFHAVRMKDRVGWVSADFSKVVN